MSLPNFLVLEMRAAFRSCAQQHRLSRQRQFSCSVAARLQKPPGSKNNPSDNWPYTGAIVPQPGTQWQADTRPGSDSRHDGKELAPRQKGETALDTGRRVPVPLRVIPKAEVAPGVKLSPRERLHIEVITRQQRKVGKPEQKKVFRERLQIYHMGALKENALIFLKMSSIASACLVTFIIAPAHLTGSTALWLTALIWFGGFVPGVLVNYATKPMISRIFIDLPTRAKESSKAAMEYAKNLPKDADIDIRYLKPWGLEGSVKARLSEFEPAQGNLLRPLSFKWKDGYKRPTSRYMPTEFYVWPETAAGKQSSNTIPGIWENVYQNLIQASKKGMAKWQGSSLSAR